MELKELKQKFVSKWIAKKTRKPFCSGNLPPVVNIKNVTRDKGGNFYTLRVNKRKGIRLEPSILESIEIISKEEAHSLRQIFWESSQISETRETTGMHVRAETGEVKRSFKESKFQAALYDLKIKFPEFDCFAYRCEECGEIHLGKEKKV